MPQAAMEMFRSHPLAASADIDHARQVLSDVYLPLNFPFASTATAVDLRLNVVRVGRITAGYLRFGDGIRIRTTEATDYHIDVPLTGRAIMRAPGHGAVYGTPRAARVFMPGRPADLDCDDAFSQLAVMIPRSELQLELENLLGRGITTPLVFCPELDLTTGPGRAFVETLHLIDRLSEGSAGILRHPVAAQRLEKTLMEVLLFSQPHNYSALLASSPPPIGPRAVARAVELLRSSPEHAWTVSELARAVSVSVRSLQEGFRRSMDTTPLGYLRGVRLERVHEELSEPETGTVAETASKWGVTHLGRFAASYQRRFAEKPSDTVRRARDSTE